MNLANKKNHSKDTKKIYDPPQLTAHGELSKITKAKNIPTPADTAFCSFHT